VSQVLRSCTEEVKRKAYRTDKVVINPNSVGMVPVKEFEDKFLVVCFLSGDRRERERETKRLTRTEGQLTGQRQLGQCPANTDHSSHWKKGGKCKKKKEKMEKKNEEQEIINFQLGHEFRKEKTKCVTYSCSTFPLPSQVTPVRVHWTGAVRTQERDPVTTRFW